MADAADTVAKRFPQTHFAIVGGQKIPPVMSYIAGFQAGAKAADPGITTLNQYSNDFVDQAKCKELGLQEIALGADVVFQVAGGCGLGALDTARERGVWGIGADADQSWARRHGRSSSLRRPPARAADAERPWLGLERPRRGVYFTSSL